MRDLARRIVAALVWLALVVVIALGAAGIVSGTDHQPGTPSRAELTYSGDLAVGRALGTASMHLTELADDVADLGVQARGALAALHGGESAIVETAIDEGDRLVGEMVGRTNALRRELADVPIVGRPDMGIRISTEVAARHTALVGALDATEGLQGAWLRLSSGSVAAIQLSGLLARHDEQVVEAAGLGRAARYEDAIESLDQADITIADARTLRNELANTVDVAVLDEWLNRNAAYDTALRGLYAEYAAVGNRVTEALRDAIAAEAAARRNLPPDTRGLVVIMAEIGRGGMSGAVIAIEEARGKLTSAIDAAAPATGSSAPP